MNKSIKASPPVAYSMGSVWTPVLRPDVHADGLSWTGHLFRRIPKRAASESTQHQRIVSIEQPYPEDSPADINGLLRHMPFKVEANAILPAQIQGSTSNDRHVERSLHHRTFHPLPKHG